MANKTILSSKSFREWLSIIAPEAVSGIDHYKECDCGNGYVRLYQAWVRAGRQPIRTVSTLLAEARAAEVPQIQGNSLALAEFWEAAANLANEKGYCEVYDQLALILGGPMRGSSEPA